MQRPLAVPGPEYKVQGWFFICTSSVCAPLAGVMADRLHPAVLTAPTCPHLLLTRKEVIVGFQTLAATCCFVQSAERSAHFSFPVQK